jgi:hypothetical protein
MIRLAENTITHEELLALSEWIPNSPQLTKGPLVIEFEKKFASFTGTKHCVMVNSGSSANLLMAYSLLEGNYLKNKKVVVPAISWITTLSPFLQFGFDVLLCDSNNVNLGLDTQKLEEIFIKEKPALLILVHVLAHLNDMEEINRLCEKYDVLLIEDACEALGTSDVNGKKAGNLSLAGSFSFYYGHHISTIEGGAVTTNDTKLYNLIDGTNDLKECIINYVTSTQTMEIVDTIVKSTTTLKNYEFIKEFGLESAGYAPSSDLIPARIAQRIANKYPSDYSQGRFYSTPNPKAVLIAKRYVAITSLLKKVGTN